MSIGFFDFGLIFAVCLTTAILAVVHIFRSAKRAPGQDGWQTSDQAEVRLTRGRVVDCDPALAELFARSGWDGTDQGLRRFFAFRFRDLPRDFPDIRTATASWPAWSQDDPATLDLTTVGSVAVIVLTDPQNRDAGKAHAARYTQQQTEIVHRAIAKAPNPAWLTDAAGRVIWSNAAYAALEAETDTPRDDGAPVLRLDGAGTRITDREQRRCVFRPRPDAPERWFDVTEDRRESSTMFHAVDVTAVVRGELAQRTFVQTLTKTFAQLSIGLAIFDRNRQLALFNPALIDLTSLSPEFLSARPGFQAFFDKLRDEKIMPEPRNYASWRDQILDLIAAAEDGRYQETWSLASGNTYRVTGRPHPNGAVAFLFDDISAEITLTRRFREQLDLSQAVMETLDDAVAVFSPQGALSYTNPAYRSLWSLDDQPSLGAPVAEVTRTWHDACDPSPIWGDFRDFVVGIEDRSEWTGTVRRRDGSTIDCQFKPLHGRATLALFRPVAAPQVSLVQVSG